MEAFALGVDCAAAVAQRAADGFLRGGRGQQQLLAGHAGQQALVPRAAHAVLQHARHLDLVHRVDHARGGAGAAQHAADGGHGIQRGAGAAEVRRDHRAEQAVLAQRDEGFVRKARVAVHRIGMRGGDGGSGLGGGDQGGGVRRRGMRRRLVHRGENGVHHAASCSCEAAAASEFTLLNSWRVSM
ncbi:hypothetical protein D3C86_1612200 [compost metagenome]